MPTKKQIGKLPKWAQEHIADLERGRWASVNKLNDYLDEQTVSDVYIEEGVCTGEQSGPATKRRYLSARSVQFSFDAAPGRSPKDREVEVAWSVNNTSTGKRYLRVSMPVTAVLIPTARNSFNIIVPDQRVD